MTRTVQEHWQVIEEMLRKKDRSRSHAEQLRGGVAGLLTTLEGRESILRRLNGEGGKFEGRQRFVDEVFRVLENPEPAIAELGPRDRLAIQEAVVKQTRPAVDSAHWNMLWLLHREGCMNAGQMVLESLGKVAKRRDDLLRTLPRLQAWERVTPDRIVSLLETAKQASRDVELTDRIERVLSWARGLRSMGEKREARNHLPVPESPIGRSANLVVEKSSVGPVESAAAPDTSSVGEQSQVPKVVSRPELPPGPEDAVQTLPMLFKAIENLFKRQDEKRAELQREQTAAREELARIRADLQVQQELTHEHSAKAERLEQVLNDRSRELAAARDQVRQLEQQLAEARQEIEAARRRAEDYIHEATLAHDNAVRSFQASLWDRLRACLVEVLDEDPHHTDLSPDQVFFRHRLQEIRDALRELGVPPY